MVKQKIVFFLDAGASKPFGIPLTAEILPKILESIKKKDLFSRIGDSIGGGDFSAVKRRQMETDLNMFLNHLMPGLNDIYEEYKCQESNKEKNEVAKATLPLITDILSIVDHIMVN